MRRTLLTQRRCRRWLHPARALSRLPCSPPPCARSQRSPGSAPHAAQRPAPRRRPSLSPSRNPVELTLRRAEEGDAQAQFRLGAAYETGAELPRDPAQAARWYRLSAEQGCAPAQLNLGLLYFEGRGVERDHALAAAWF